jgi:hypothetical protein
MKAPRVIRIIAMLRRASLTAGGVLKCQLRGDYEVRNTGTLVLVSFADASRVEESQSSGAPIRPSLSRSSFRGESGLGRSPIVVSEELQLQQVGCYLLLCQATYI